MKPINWINPLQSLAMLMALMLALGLCLPSYTYAAESAVVTVSVSEQDIGPGEEFTVIINVEPNNSINGMQFDMQFDPSLVTAADVIEGNLLYQNGAMTYFNPGTIDNQAGIITGVFGIARITATSFFSKPIIRHPPQGYFFGLASLTLGAPGG